LPGSTRALGACVYDYTDVLLKVVDKLRPTRKLDQPILQTGHNALPQHRIDNAVRPVGTDTHPVASDTDWGKLDSSSGDLGAEAKLCSVD
jgi:hypothetical protein